MPITGTAEGQMYFGGINGITTFHPEQIVDNPYTPPVLITKLHLFNQTVFPNDGTGILQNSISNTKSITLSSKQSMFSLDFVVSNYISGNQNTFAYMLKGYDRDWYYSNTLRTVSYSNLPAGTYHFLVKAANSDGKWNETPTETGNRGTARLVQDMVGFPAIRHRFCFRYSLYIPLLLDAQKHGSAAENGTYG